MSMFLRLSAKRLLTATVLLMSCLLVQPAARSGQDAAEDASYNPLRSGEKPWSRDQRLFDSAPAKPQPAPAAAVQRFRIPKLRTTQPQEAAAPTRRTRSADAMPAEFLTTGDRSASAVSTTSTTEGANQIPVRPIPVVARPPAALDREPTEAQPQPAAPQRATQPRPMPVRLLSLQGERGRRRLRLSRSRGAWKDCRRAPLHRTDRSQRRTRAGL